MKKMLAIILSAVFCAMGISACAAQKEALTITLQIDNPVMTVNGEEKPIDEQGTAPVIVNDRTLLPVRAIVEEIGGKVEWDGETQTVILACGKDIIVLGIDNTTAYHNNETHTLDAAPTIINDRTMLPIRFIAESFGLDVEWNGDEQRITISKSNQSNNSDEIINLTSQETELEKGLSAVRYDGEYMFDEFLEQGGAGTDAELVRFLQKNIVQNAGQLNFTSDAFGCSVLSVKNENGEAIFGRNFDWYSCNGLILMAKPTNGYASISTVNTNFITNAYKSFNSLPDNIRSVVSMYAPLDGMNEKGLCAAVLYIEDAAAINQNTDKPDITTTTAIRLMLDKAAIVDEALELLNQYDMHDSLGMMVHFAISDSSGKCAAVEYINNEMIVTETPVVTNFYLSEGNKQGIGSSQSHTRFETLTNTIRENTTMNMAQVRNALDSVSKHNFNDGETTEWSIVYNQAQVTAQYYHRENYDKSYTFKIP